MICFCKAITIIMIFVFYITNDHQNCVKKKHFLMIIIYTITIEKMRGRET